MKIPFPCLGGATGLPLVAAAIALIWANGEPTPEAGKTSGVGSGGQPNHRVQVSDPARALVHAYTLENRTERETLIRELLAEWAVRDAGAALGWVASLEDPAARRSARSTVCFALAEKDPRRAVTLALAHGADEEDGRGLLECLTMQWCQQETGDAVDWAHQQPPGEWRERLLASASFVLSKCDPVAAAQLVSGLEPGAVQDEAAMAVLHQWALKDSSAALQWAEGFAEASLKDRALVEITNLRNWAASSQEVK